jgi:hypothetical protein
MEVLVIYMIVIYWDQQRYGGDKARGIRRHLDILDPFRYICVYLDTFG